MHVACVHASSCTVHQEETSLTYFLTYSTSIILQPQVTEHVGRHLNAGLVPGIDELDDRLGRQISGCYQNTFIIILLCFSLVFLEKGARAGPV